MIKSENEIQTYVHSWITNGNRFVESSPYLSNKIAYLVKLYLNSACVKKSLYKNFSILRYIANYLISRNCYKAFKGRANDIFIVSYPRSGTTWVCNILYQLISKGNMDFVHLSEKVPFLDRALGYPTYLEYIEKMEGRRLFKSHIGYSEMPKYPCKYIYVYRDGKSVANSYYYFYKTYIGLRENFKNFMLYCYYPGFVQYGSYYKHLKNWFQNKYNLDVLYVNYDDCINSFDKMLTKIADHIGIKMNEELEKKVTEYTNFKFMKEHSLKFAHHMEIKWEYENFVQQIDNNNYGHIRKGETDDWKNQFDDYLINLHNKHKKKYLNKFINF